MRFVFHLAISFAASFPLLAQAPTGLAFDPYGTYPAVYQHPTAGLSSPYGWELQLGGQVNFENNYLFIRLAAGLGLTTRVATASQLGVINDTQRWVVDDRIYDFDYFDDGAERFGRFESSVSGPSLSFRLGEDWRIGIGGRLRAVGNVAEVDAQLSYYPYEALSEGSSITIQPGKAQGAAWAEVNLNLAKRFLTASGELGIGINAKYIRPLSGVRLLVDGETVITKINRGSVGLANTDIQLALSGDLLQNDPGTAGGQGVGIDVGLTYGFGDIVGPNDRPRVTIGLAILDLGGITFDETSEVHRFSAEPRRVIDGENYEFATDGLASLPAAIEQLNRDFYPDDPTRESLEGQGFVLGLPTRTALSLAYQIDESFGFDGRLMLNTPLGPNALRAGQGVTAHARYSKWWYGGGLSLNFHEFREINVGLYLRMGPLYLGTDRLFGTVVSRERLAAGDFFLGLRLHSFRERRERSRRNRGRRGRSRYNECYEF